MIQGGQRLCRWCYSPIDPTTGDCPTGCYTWDAYWRGLTPAEQDAELAMMDAYVAARPPE